MKYNNLETQHIGNKMCCDMMQHNMKNNCNIHDNPFDCPDCLIWYVDKFNEYGVIIHDGGDSFVTIKYCPWCGKKLPESLRDVWFDKIIEMGFDPSEDKYPDEYKTWDWWKNKEGLDKPY